MTKEHTASSLANHPLHRIAARLRILVKLKGQVGQLAVTEGVSHPSTQEEYVT
jgi:hypothetical protein